MYYCLSRVFIEGFICGQCIPITSCEYLFESLISKQTTNGFLWVFIEGLICSQCTDDPSPKLCVCFDLL
jgi:hypothetical protein